jgi:hypothetical protein
MPALILSDVLEFDRVNQSQGTERISSREREFIKKNASE